MTVATPYKSVIMYPVQQTSMIKTNPHINSNKIPVNVTDTRKKLLLESPLFDFINNLIYSTNFFIIGSYFTHKYFKKN